MKYFCEYNGNFYDTQEECLKAEAHYRLYEEIETAKKEMNEAQEVYVKAKEKYERAVRNFNQNTGNVCNFEDMDIKILNPVYVEDKCECNCDGKCKVEETENGFIIYGDETSEEEFFSLIEEFIKFNK